MRYGTVEVLDGLTFSARRGEVLTLLGPNGAGKTHDDRDSRGLPDPVGGRGDGARRRPRRGRRGLARAARRGAAVLARPRRWRVRQLLPHLAAYYRPYSTPDGSARWTSTSLLEVVGLTEHGAKKVGSLSGGQRRRLDVAIGIVGRPERALPRRAHDRLRPSGAPGLPRRRAPVGRPGGHDDPAHHARPRRGREAGRPHPHPGRRPHRRRRQRRPARAPGGGAHGGAVEPRRGALRARGGGRDAVRPRALRPVRRQHRRPRGEAGDPGGQLHGAGEEIRVRCRPDPAGEGLAVVS